MKSKQSTSVRLTSRKRIVDVLTEEITGTDSPKAFRLPSEHNLTRRFGVSRVTIRLALSDMEHRGLIFRKHGKGTFAHGHITRNPRNIVVFLASPQAMNHSDTIDLIRGVEALTHSQGASTILTRLTPEKWDVSLVSRLSGVIVAGELSVGDRINLQLRKLPFFSLHETYPTQGTNEGKITGLSTDDIFNLGQSLALQLNRAFRSGQSGALELNRQTGAMVSLCHETSRS